MIITQKKMYCLYFYAIAASTLCKGMENNQPPILPRVIEEKPKIYRMPSGTQVRISPKGTVRKRSLPSGELTVYNTNNIVKVIAAHPILYKGKYVTPCYYYSDFTTENSYLKSSSVNKALKKAQKSTEKKQAVPGNQ